MGRIVTPIMDINIYKCALCSTRKEHEPGFRGVSNNGRLMIWTGKHHAAFKTLDHIAILYNKALLASGVAVKPPNRIQYKTGKLAQSFSCIDCIIAGPPLVSRIKST